MALPILDATAVYRMGARAHEAWHLDAIERRNVACGLSMTVHQDDTPLVAFVNSNRWVVLCQCRAGNAVDLASSTARCGECGAFHPNVSLPSNRVEIEAALTARPDPFTRNWSAGGTVAELLAENLSLGVKE